MKTIIIGQEKKILDIVGVSKYFHPSPRGAQGTKAFALIVYETFKIGFQDAGDLDDAGVFDIVDGTFEMEDGDAIKRKNYEC